MGASLSNIFIDELGNRFSHQLKLFLEEIILGLLNTLLHKPKLYSSSIIIQMHPKMEIKTRF